MKIKNKIILLVSIVFVITILISVKHHSEEDEVRAYSGNVYSFTEVDKYNVTLKDGVFKGSAEGFNGNITVEMSVEDGSIVGIRVTDHNENETIAKQALNSIPKEIVKNQTFNVDSVSSATKTSNGIKNAVKDCIKQAGGNPNDY